ncbi:MAG: hypothetical protein KF861_24395, partial [Planctomycetaceae bacterium]|nr:hypothetical protein [Planctomycetaceae bacterium]
MHQFARPTSIIAVSPVAASAWRFFRHGSGTLVSAVMTLCAVPALMYGMIWILDSETARQLTQDPGVLQTVFRGGLWIALPLYVLSEMTQIRSLFELPITNRQIL